MKSFSKRSGGLLVCMLGMLLLASVPAQAVVDGITGSNFTLVARQGFINSPDGDTILMWGYANGAGGMQYPGPTLIVSQGATVTVTLRNELPAVHGQNVSIVFPGQVVTASGGVPGALTREVPPDNGLTSVTYTFTATQPGTYLYRSGTRPDLQTEMGLQGALIVRSSMPAVEDPRPNTGPINYAYNHADTAYHHEYLYLLSEVDVNIHRLVETGHIAQVDTTQWFPVHWFINGRAFPDLLQPPFVPWLPSQPYNCVPRTHPFEKVLIRVVGAGRQYHPMHYHAADFAVIGQNGRMLSSNGGAAGPDLAVKGSTFNFIPGHTADLLWEWTGADIGWDIYGHAPGDPYLEGYELQDPGNDDHGKPFPVILAERDDLAFGQFWSGSPFLGGMGDLPPDHPGTNTGGGYLFPWHSHSEKELTSNNIFPGGTLSFVILEHPRVPIP
jgi:hypothetical protein